MEGMYVGIANKIKLIEKVAKEFGVAKDSSLDSFRKVVEMLEEYICDMKSNRVKLESRIARLKSKRRVL